MLALEDLQLRGMLLLFDAISISRAREKYILYSHSQQLFSQQQDRMLKF